MRKLNPIILEEVAARFCLERKNQKVTYGWYTKANEDSKLLARFMLSARECFNATLEYYKRAKIIEIHSHTIIVPFVGKKFSAHIIPYRFILVTSLLNVLSTSVEDLTIIECPKDRRGYDILDQLIHKGLKRVSFQDLIGTDYMERFKSECALENLKSVGFDVNSPSISDIFSIKSSCHEIRTNFKDLLSHMNVDYFPGVENVSFDIKLEKNNSIHFVTLPGALENISTLITENFPSLKNVKLLFWNEEEEIDFIFVLNHILGAFRRDCFYTISGRVKGIIHSRFTDTLTCFNTAAESLQREENFTFDYVNRKIIKEEEIHNRLLLKIEVTCLGFPPNILDIVSSDDENVPFPHLYG